MVVVVVFGGGVLELLYTVRRGEGSEGWRLVALDDRREPSYYSVVGLGASALHMRERIFKGPNSTEYSSEYAVSYRAFTEYS